jgi:hypothetical protein
MLLLLLLLLQQACTARQLARPGGHVGEQQRHPAAAHTLHHLAGRMRHGLRRSTPAAWHQQRTAVHNLPLLLLLLHTV